MHFVEPTPLFGATRAVSHVHTRPFVSLNATAIPGEGAIRCSVQMDTCEGVSVCVRVVCVSLCVCVCVCVSVWPNVVQQTSAETTQRQRPATPVMPECLPIYNAKLPTPWGLPGRPRASRGGGPCAAQFRRLGQIWCIRRGMNAVKHLESELLRVWVQCV